MSDIGPLPPAPASRGRPRVVLDTDTFNEIDDQFALAYLLRAGDRVTTEAVYAAPYVRGSAKTPRDGMELSYEEIGRLLDLLDMSDTPRSRGAERFLSPRGTGSTAAREEPEPGPEAAPVSRRDGPGPADSPAARDLALRALATAPDERLMIVAIGALTNIASALLLEPEIARRATVIWLGGHYPMWPHQNEFNLTGDPVAAGMVFDSGIPLYVVPCLGVASVLRTTEPELRQHLRQTPLSAFLLKRFVAFGRGADLFSKVIWDIAAIAWLVLPDAVQSFPMATPRVTDSGYVHDPRRHQCRFAYELDRDAIYRDLFARL